MSYLLTVTNLGPNTATEVVVQDQLPSGVTLVSGEVQQGVCFESEEQSIACQLGVLPSGASAQVRIDVNVNSSVASTSLLNQAFVEFAGEDVDPEDNFAEAEITVLGSTGLGSDLRLEKEDSPDPVEPGGLLTYTLSVKNTGPGPAVGVLLRDDLSFGVTLVSVESTQGTCSTTERVVGCELGNLENGGIATVEIIVQVDPSAAGAILSNTAFVRSSSVDFNDDNNSVLQETTVLGSSGLEADLALTKIDSVDPVEPGSVLAYALTVENKGPNVANGVVLVDILPSKVSFGSADASQGDCSHTDGVVDCNLGALQPEALVTVQILVEVDSSVTSTTLLNSAFVEGLEPDSNIDNNSAPGGDDDFQHRIGKRSVSEHGRLTGSGTTGRDSDLLSGCLKCRSGFRYRGQGVRFSSSRGHSPLGRSQPGGVFPVPGICGLHPGNSTQWHHGCRRNRGNRRLCLLASCGWCGSGGDPDHHQLGFGSVLQRGLQR